jgi:hypothetical protein
MRQVSHPTSPVVTSIVVDSINLSSENYRIDTRPRILGEFSATNHLGTVWFCGQSIGVGTRHGVDHLVGSQQGGGKSDEKETSHKRFDYEMSGHWIKQAATGDFSLMT